MAETAEAVPDQLVEEYAAVFQDLAEVRLQRMLIASVSVGWHPRNAAEWLKYFVAMAGNNEEQLHGCVSAFNKDPVFGVIGIQSGPRDKGPQWLPSNHGSRGWDAGGGDDC